MLQGLENRHAEGEGKSGKAQQEGGLPGEEGRKREGKKERKAVPGMRGMSYTKSWQNLMLSGNIDAFGPG